LEELNIKKALLPSTAYQTLQMRKQNFRKEGERKGHDQILIGSAVHTRRNKPACKEVLARVGTETGRGVKNGKGLVNLSSEKKNLGGTKKERTKKKKKNEGPWLQFLEDRQKRASVTPAAAN